MKEKLTVKEQIEHMKSKGIQFNIIDEKEAEQYLSENTYYFKLKSYAKNYDKYRSTEKQGQYVNLEFAYLKDLAIIDMHLRHFILKTSIDLEHTLKTRFLKDFNESEDNGYDLVEKFLSENHDIEERIKKKKDNSYTKDLANKLIKEGFAVWNIVELLSLKDFLRLYKRFYEEYPDSLNGHYMYYPMQGVRKLRNAAAHSNCLINSLRKPYSGNSRYNSKVNAFVKRISGMDKLSIKNNMSNQVVYDFVTMLYLVDDMVKSQQMKEKIITEIHDLIHGRMVRNAGYYKKESSIRSAYIFIQKTVDFLDAKTYNNKEI